jgi:acetyl esterase/lipase
MRSSQALRVVLRRSQGRQDVPNAIGGSRVARRLCRPRARNRISLELEPEGGHSSCASSVQTLKLTSVFGLNVRVIGTSVDLKGLPPTTIINAEIDPLRSDGDMLTDKMKADGDDVTHKNYSGVTHEFFGMTRSSPRPRKPKTSQCHSSKRPSTTLSRARSAPARGNSRIERDAVRSGRRFLP